MSTDHGRSLRLSVWRKSDWLQRILNASSIAIAAALFGVIWQYGPESMFKLPASRYVISALCALAGLFIIQFVRSRAVDSPAGTHDVSRVRRLPPQGEVAAQLEAAVSTDSAGNQGWCHYLGSHNNEQSISPLSTAYALRTAILCNLELPDVDVNRVIRSIALEANHDGGWSTQSQGSISRPEATAVIGGTLARISGFTPLTEKAAQRVREMIASKSDPLVTTDTFVLAILLEEAPYLRLPRQQIKQLVESLLAGAVQTEGGETYWTERLVDAAHASSSVALTARALIAIHGVVGKENIFPTWGPPIVKGATRWLEKASDLHNETSQVIRYPQKGMQEIHVPRHFTAALVTLALIAAGDTDHPALRRALNKVWGQYSDGLWWWDSGQAPTWMTYYGLSAAVVANRSGADTSS